MKPLLDPDEAPGLLSFLLPPRSQFGHVLAGVDDDDCAVMRLGEELLVVTTDFLNSRPIATELGLGSYWHLGRLVIASSLSDLCGTGAKPFALLLATMLERGTLAEDFEELARGAAFEADKWKVPIVGGDTKLGKADAILSVGLGTAKSERNLFLKNAAKPGDLLWVSGPIGNCSAATIGLTSGNMPEDWNSWARAAILEPSPPLTKSWATSEMRLGHGGIDISDGLGDDLHRLCSSSQSGVVLDLDAIPISEEARHLALAINVPPWSLAFASGGDFQFLLTSAQSSSTALSDLGFSCIGEMTAKSSTLIRHGGETRGVLPAGGHRDIRSQTFAAEMLSIISEVESAIGTY